MIHYKQTYQDTIEEMKTDLLNLLNQKRFYDEQERSYSEVNGNYIPIKVVYPDSDCDYDGFTTDFQGNVVLCRNGYYYPLSFIPFDLLCDIVDSAIEYYQKEMQ